MSEKLVEQFMSYNRSVEDGPLPMRIFVGDGFRKELFFQYTGWCDKLRSAADLDREAGMDSYPEVSQYVRNQKKAFSDYMNTAFGIRFNGDQMYLPNAGYEEEFFCDSINEGISVYRAAESDEFRRRLERSISAAMHSVRPAIEVRKINDFSGIELDTLKILQVQNQDSLHRTDERIQNWAAFDTTEGRQHFWELHSKFFSLLDDEEFIEIEIKKLEGNS